MIRENEARLNTTGPVQKERMMTKATNCCNNCMQFVSREGHVFAPQNSWYESGTWNCTITYAENYFKIVESYKNTKTVFCSLRKRASTHVQQFAAQESPGRNWIPPQTSFLAAHWLQSHLENHTYLGWQKQCSQGLAEMQMQACSQLYSVSEKTRLKNSH